jgi:hypothetical protein
MPPRTYRCSEGLLRADALDRIGRWESLGADHVVVMPLAPPADESSPPVLMLQPTGHASVDSSVPVVGLPCCFPVPADATLPGRR